MASEPLSKKLQSEGNGMTRRSFVSMMVGSIVLLPTVQDALMLPDSAYADESGQTATLVQGSTIYVVRTNELALIVQDVSLPDGSANYVSGATVKLTSRFNGESLEDVTNERGEVVFDISALSETDGKQEKPAVYGFNGTIEISASGFRNFRAPLLLEQGAFLSRSI